MPISVIGNGIDLPDLDQLPPPEAILPEELRARRTCLYLGRLHPIKGVDRLLRAWRRLRPSDEWQLVIAGGAGESYRAELEALARPDCRNLRFVGEVAGDLKSAWFRQAELFVLPSRSEAFPMALLEAFSFGTPALITAACGFPDAAAAGAAVEVESNEGGLVSGLEEMLRMSPSHLQFMGAAAHSLVSERFTWAKISGQLESVYAWMRSNGPPPPCLRLS